MPDAATPYSARPSALNQPVPGATQEADLEQFLSNYKAPKAAAPPSQPQAPGQVPDGAAPPPQQPAGASSDNLEEFLASQGIGKAPDAQALETETPDGVPAPVTAEPRPQTTLQKITDYLTLSPAHRKQLDASIDRSAENSPYPTGMYKFVAHAIINNTIGLPQQIGDSAIRAKGGLGRENTSEPLAGYVSMLGKDNVKVVDGDVQIRYPGAKDFHSLKQAGVEVMGDLADSSRQVVKEYAMIPGLAANLINPAAYIASRSLMQPYANAYADKVAKDAGIAQDPARDKIMENATDMAAEALIPLVAHTAAKFIPGTAAFKSRMVKRAADAFTQAEDTKVMVQTAERLDSSGFFQDFGQGVKLRLDQLYPNDSRVQQKVAAVKDMAGFQNVQTQWFDNVVKGIKGTWESISGQPGGDVPHLVESLGSTVKTIDSLEGHAIGELRAKAMVELKNQKLPVPDALNQQAETMMQALGFQKKLEQIDTITRPTFTKEGGPRSMVRINYLPPTDRKTLDKLKGTLGITDGGQLQSFINTLAHYANTADNGLRISEIDALTKRIGDLNPTADRAGGSVKQAWGQFSSDLRQFRRDAIKSGLNNEIDQKAFDSTMDKFSMIRQNTKDLRTLLDGDFTADTIVKKVFTPGQAGLGNLKAIKALVMQDAPGTYEALKQHWVDDMFTRHSVDGKFNAVGMRNEISKYSDTFLKEAFEGTGATLQSVKDQLAYAAYLQQTWKNAGAVETLSEQTKKGLMNGLFGSMVGSPTKMYGGFSQALGLNIAGNPLNEIITKEGIEKYLAKYEAPAYSKTLIAEHVRRLIQTAQAQQAFPIAQGALIRASQQTLDKKYNNTQKPK